MLTIFDEGWKVWAIPPRRFVPFESPRPRVPGIGFKMSVPNRVWDFMGSPLLTYLASNILVVAQADLPFENMHIYLVGSLLADNFLKQPGPVRTHSFAGPPCPAEDPVIPMCDESDIQTRDRR